MDLIGGKWDGPMLRLTIQPASTRDDDSATAASLAKTHVAAPVLETPSVALYSARHDDQRALDVIADPAAYVLLAGPEQVTAETLLEATVTGMIMADDQDDVFVALRLAWNPSNILSGGGPEPAIDAKRTLEEDDAQSL